MRAKQTPQFATEVELCAAFIAAAPKAWTAYPETAGWDILLVRSADGFQIGIQAKLKFNLQVINQTIEDGWYYSMESPGPDCRAVLIPDFEGPGLGRICGYIGLSVIRMRRLSATSKHWNKEYQPQLPDLGDRHGHADWHEFMPAQRHRLPEYVPDVAAGAPAPLQLTSWKIAAIKLTILMQRRGYLTRADFKHLGIDHRRWTAKEAQSCIPSPQGYIAGPHFPNFRTEHPRVCDEIAADFDKWKPPMSPLLGSAA